jgi:23S rRNA pseudouridine2605 synthase
MNEQELQQLRQQKWRLDGHPVRTFEEARGFIESVGFSQMYASQSSLLLPTFVGAWIGSDQRLPTARQAFADAQAREASELMVRLLRDRAAFEAHLTEENNSLLIAASVFPYFYALAGERNPRQPPVAGARSPYSQLASDAHEVIRRAGPVSKQQLLTTLGKGISETALDRALTELWSKLRITRVDYDPENGASWDLLLRWAPEAVREGIQISVPEAISALISKYFDGMIAADQAELDSMFGVFVSRSRIRDAVNTLLAARELSFVHLGNRTLIQIAAPRIAHRA